MQIKNAVSTFQRLCASTSGLLLIATSIQAQSARSGAPASGETVNLPEFTVTAGSHVGYIASESVTGSRVATPIKDLPFAVNVVTSEFLDDFAFFDIEENLGYTSSVNAVDNAGNNTIRGYTSQYMLRDGFFRIGMNDKTNIDRIEVIKGPSAAIYGQAQPGGMINVITKHPKQVKEIEGTAGVSVGSYDTIRGQFNLTGPVGLLGETYFLVTGADYERTYDTPMATLRNRSVGVALQHYFSNGGNLLVQYNYMRNQSHSVRSTVPELYNSTTKRYEGLALDLANLQQNGPNSETSRDVNDVTITFEQRLNSVFSVRAATNWYHRHKWLFNAGNGSQYDYLKNTLSRGTPSYGLIGEDGGGVQADLLARYKFFNGKVTNKTLLTFDFSDYYRWDPTWQLASQYQITDPSKIPSNGMYWLKTITIGQPIDYTIPAFNPAVYSNVTRYNKNRASIWGANLRHQMGLFDDTLLLFASLRYDNVKFALRDYLKHLDLKPSATAWSPSAGFNYKATSHIAVYGSRSNGFNANAQNRAASDGTQPNEKSYGYDYGVKCSFLDDRLVFTTGGYYIVRENVKTTELLPDGTTANAFEGSQLARGFEFDFTYRVMDNFTILGGYGHTNAKYTYFGRNIGAVGRPTSKVPKDNLGVAAKYEFTGALNGFSLTAGVIYMSEIAAENPSTGDQFAPASAGGAYLGNDGRADIMIPSYYTVDLGAHYRFKTKGSLTHTVDLNVKNIFDKFYISASRYATDGRGYYLSYRLGF
ncbi:MAG TPA: TonB-dependent receptor [Opitutaceae bacterium]|nr:TonB-dependent receptor [Opitutaceae bacterium]